MFFLDFGKEKMPKKEKAKYHLSGRVIHTDVSIEVIIFLYISNQNSMNGNGTELEECVHTHRTSCRSVWPN